MSNKRKRRRGRVPLVPRSTAILAAQVGAVERGCTCNAEVEITHEHGITHVWVRHDDDCPALRAP